MSHTEQIQAALAERMSGFPLVAPAPQRPHWAFGTLTDAQLRDVAAQEAAYRAGLLVRPAPAL